MRIGVIIDLSDVNVFRILKKYGQINWALADQAMVSGVNFMTGVLFARFLGLEEYGRFTLAWMAVLFFNSFQQSGIISPMMSIGPKQETENQKKYYGTIFIHQVIWSVACFFLLLISVWLTGFLKPDWHIQNLALPLSFTLLSWQLQEFLRRYYFVRGHGGLAFLNDGISYLAQLLLIVISFRIVTLQTSMVLWIIAGTSATAVLVGVFKIDCIAWPSGMFVDITKKHWHFSKWMLASALMQWTSGNFFIISAGTILGPISAGALKAAQNIMGVSHILFQGLDNVVPSRASYCFVQGGWPKLWLYLKRVIYWAGTATATISLMAWLFSDFWLNLFYGKEYQLYGYLLKCYAVIYLFIFLGLPLRAGLRALEHSKPIFISYCLMTAFTALTADFFINNMGLLGATTGILCTQIIYQTSLIYALWRKGFCAIT